MRFGIPCMGDVNARTGPTGNGRILAQSRPKYAGLTLGTGDPIGRNCKCRWVRLRLSEARTR
jgi:hypothetical protein